MLYFSNQELASSYHVSVRTVRNWIESAKAGKLDLSLQTKGERTYIANTSKNKTVMDGLAVNGKKYRPHRAYKTVSPRAEFYEIFSQSQIYDIVSNLEIHHELPRQYNYFDKGAHRWDEYADRLAEEDGPNMLTSAIKLLENNSGYIDDLIKQFKHVNVVDLGAGNALPVKGLLRHLIDQKKLGRYVAVDISPEMLEIAEHNVKTWFGESIQVEKYARDILYERFMDILAGEYIKKDSSETINLILFLGGTPCNFRDPNMPFRVIHDSMGVSDLLIHQQKLDTSATRKYFDFNTNPGVTTLAPNHRLIFDLFNIDESLYNVEMGFDEERSERYIRVRLKVALSIKFTFEDGERLINFNKDDTILLWRYVHSNALQVLKRLADNDLNPLQASQTDDQEFILTISRIKRD